MSRPRLASMLFVFGLAYLLSLFFRSVNAIIAPNLAEDMGLTEVDLGLLTSAYFLGLGLMQIPIGILLDALGPRVVQSVLLLVAAIGVALFSVAEGLWLLTLARGLIGIGLAGCLMSAYQVAALWLPADRVALANGCYLAVGGLGVLVSTAPVEFALDFMGWRELFALVAGATLLTAIAIAVTTPPLQRDKPPSWGDQIRGVLVVSTNPNAWRYLPLTAICFATGTAFQGLWAASWLRDIAGYDRSTVALYLTAMAVALTVGSAAGGAVSLMFKGRGIDLRHVVLGSAAIFMMAQVGIVFGPTSGAIVFWLALAMTYNVVTLSYPLVAQTLPRSYVGRSNTFMNTIVIISTFVIQFGIGISLQYWEADELSGRAYTITFSILLLIQAVFFVWCLIGPVGSRFEKAAEEWSNAPRAHEDNSIVQIESKLKGR